MRFVAVRRRRTGRGRGSWSIYDDSVFDAAQARVDLALEVAARSGIDAIGEVGDPDPYTATMDAVREYSPDEIIISTYPETRSGWLRARPDRARRRARPGCRSSTWSPTSDTEGLPFDVTLAVANRTASGDELLDALKAKPTRPSATTATCSSSSCSAGGRRRPARRRERRRG